MGEEIDEYILKKLNNAIDEAKSTEFHLPAQLLLRPKLSKQLEELKDILANTPPSRSGAAAADHESTSNIRREQLYYLNNVLTEWQTITKKPISYSPEAITSVYNLRQSLKNIKQDLRNGIRRPLDGVNGNGTTEASNPKNPETQYRWSSRYLGETNVHGLEDKVLSMERMLVLRREKDDPFKAVGIFGMAGIGKTTLCQLIFSRPKVQKYFFPRIWVCMSKQPKDDNDNRKEIVKRMLMCLGVDDKIIKIIEAAQDHQSHVLRDLLFALRLQLTGKRYLIVLDDAWSDDEWFKMMDPSEMTDQQFAYGLPKDCGGTVIVTSRIKEVAKKMVGEEENLHCLLPLSDSESCWLIFKDWVTKGGTPFPQDLESLKKDIVKRCDGLPLAAKMMGEIKNEQLRESAIGSSENPREVQQPA